MFPILACLILSTTLWTSTAEYANNSETINEKECTTAQTVDYGYKIWFNFDQSMMVGDGGDVLLKFYVRTNDNAHVLLSRGPSTSGYEIVIGAGFNKFSEIRKITRPNNNFVKRVKSAPTNSFLNASIFVGFWIRMSQESGLIEVGKAGDKLPFIFWKDSKLVPIEYLSFSSWYGSLGQWLFKCKSDLLVATPIKSESTDHVTKFLTSSERLRRNVLRQRGKFGVGNPVSNSQELLTVGMAGEFRFIHLDVMTSTLTLRGRAVFEWMDHGIHWNPQDYSNISKLHLSNYELWRPELVLHNALDPAASLFSESEISVDNTGRVVWNPKFDMKTKCAVDLKLWPWDRHKCVLVMSPWSHKISNVIYEMITNNQSKCFHESHSDWKLDSMTSYYVQGDPTPWDEVIATINEDEYEETDDFKQVSLQLTVEISRNTKILEKLFYIPLLLISGLWLSSFCVMPNSSSKITIICISIILSTSILVYMTSYIPVFAESPPDLLLGYLKLMLMMSTDAFISSFLIKFHDRKTTSGHPPFVVTRLLTIPVVTKCLVLPKLDYNSAEADYDDYSRVVDNDGSDGARSTAEITLWDVVIVAFERVVFAVYFVITVNVLLSIGIFIKS